MSTRDELNHASDAIRAGDKTTARQILTKVLQTEKKLSKDDAADAWYLMAYTLSTNDQRRQALQKVLTFRPNDERAKQKLNQLDAADKVQTQPPIPSNKPDQPQTLASFVQAAQAAPPKPAQPPVSVTGSKAPISPSPALNPTAQPKSPEKSAAISRPHRPWLGGILSVIITLAIIVGLMLALVAYVQSDPAHYKQINGTVRFDRIENPILVSFEVVAGFVTAALFFAIGPVLGVRLTGDKTRVADLSNVATTCTFLNILAPIVLGAVVSQGGILFALLALIVLVFAFIGISVRFAQLLTENRTREFLIMAFLLYIFPVGVVYFTLRWIGGLLRSKPTPTRPMTREERRALDEEVQRRKDDDELDRRMEREADLRRAKDDLIQRIESTRID